MSPRGRQRGYFSLFSLFPEEEKGWPFSSRAVHDPKEGKESCCHGGLCEANSSRVKWEIFIPRVRQSAAVSGQRSRAGIFRTQQGHGARAGGPLGMSLAVYQPAIWVERGLLWVWGICSLLWGGPGLQEIPVGYVSPLSLGPCDPLLCGLVW
uniref:Uncharacterized protein n=1 Tax=Molossus molossus TaxID=27622 RepID=A0A7J8C8W4_MOLMO|nr:hypothetical protein HJG59_009909 [Molossus molossus]